MPDFIIYNNLKLEIRALQVILSGKVYGWSTGSYKPVHNRFIFGLYIKTEPVW